jgi:hypothetical protein
VLELSACISAHRCSGTLWVGFVNSANAVLSYASGNAVVGNQAARGSYTDFPKSKLIVTVPAGAVGFFVFFRMDSVTGNTPFMFVSALMIAGTTATATETSPYVAPGITSIDGSGIISGSITARTIAADQITARHLVLGDPSNMVPNGDFLNGSSDGWVLQGNAYVQPVAANDAGGQWRVSCSNNYVAGYLSRPIQVTPGDTLYISGMVYSTHSSGNTGFILEFTDQDGGAYTASYHYTGLKGQWTRVEGRAVVPAGRQRVQVVMFSDLAGGVGLYGKIQLRRAASAEMVVDGAIITRHMTAGTINADRLVAQSITTAQIAAGAIKTDQLDVGAVTAGKIGVGLSSGNLVWNSDQALAGWYGFAASIAGPTIGLRAYLAGFVVTGTKNAVQIYCPGTPAAGQYAYFDLWYPNADNSPNSIWPIQAGKQYEFTVYVSVHRCTAYVQMVWMNAAGNVVATSASPRLAENGAGPVPSEGWRGKVQATAPSDATGVILRVVQDYDGRSEPYVMASGFYLGVVPAGTSTAVFSDYAPQGNTIITGAGISTNSLNANRIVANTITTTQIQSGGVHADRLVANSITTGQIATGGVHADRLVAGSITSTQIAANTISAAKLLIGMRPMTCVGLNFEMQVDGNGNKTGWLTWTAGYIAVLGDANEFAGFGIVAGSIYTGFQETHVWWDRGAGYLSSRVGGSDVLNSERIPMAYWSSASGLAVLKGGIQIDGDKITTRSIKAAKIGVGEIQTGHMSANSISGDRIQAGTLSADRITTGTLTVNAVLNIGSQTELWSDGNGGGYRWRNKWNDQWRGTIGYLGPWTGDTNDFGIIIWGTDNNVKFRVSNAQNYINGLMIGDAEIINAKIANLTLGNEKIQNEAVTRGAFGATGANNREVIVPITVRNAGTRLVIWGFRTGGAGYRDVAGAVTGNLQIWVARPGQGWGLIRDIPNAHSYEWQGGVNANWIRHMPTSDCVQFDTYEGGYHQIMVRDTSASPASAVTVAVVEFSK